MPDLKQVQIQKIKRAIREGMSQRDVASKYGITRYQVRVVCATMKMEHSVETPLASSGTLVEEYRDQVIEWAREEKISAFLITRRLKEKGCIISESTIKRLVRKIKSEVYVPIHTAPGEQAQVDFGYLGHFNKDGQSVKVWVFCMVLSHSRYAYYTTVTNQSTFQFLQCHRQAFEYFGGVPRSILIDNLGAAVKKSDQYQPYIQTQYNDFLDHYKSSVLTARICRGQDKGKVESGIKYVKNNFLKNCQHRDFQQLQNDLKTWNKQECNLRIHGTTRKVPHELFIKDEKRSLIPLPKHPFTITVREERMVNKFGHVFYEYNFYSVPSHYCGEKLIVEDDGKHLRVYKGRKLITLHQLNPLKGKYITIESHKPYYKQIKSVQYYQEIVIKIGEHVAKMLELMRIEKPLHWKKMIKGIIRLSEVYSNYLVDLACEKALSDAKHDYQQVRTILAKRLYITQKTTPRFPKGVGGFYHELEVYDQLATSCLTCK